jgi:hypothetical protein
VGLLTWLFGKKQTSEDPRTAPAAALNHRATTGERPPGSEAENLRRWQESGQARAWVQARKGQWNHADWLALLSDLKRSPYWPVQPEAVGQVLEQIKREWVQRN